MDKLPVVAVTMGFDHFLIDSNGGVYDLTAAAADKKVLNTQLQYIRTRVTQLAKTHMVVVLTEILTPYEHAVSVEPSWWYKYLVTLGDASPNVKLISNRGIVTLLCGSCKQKVKPAYIRYPKWTCPYCHVVHDTEQNILSNMQTHYEYYQVNQTRLGKTKHPKQIKTNDSHLPYLYSKVKAKIGEIYSKEYEIATDKKTLGFLRNMDRISRRIRSEISEEVSKNGYDKLDHRGWVDEWNDPRGQFSGYRHGSRSTIAALSISDTIISICHSVTVTGQIPKPSDDMWVTYWRNIIVDRVNKRIALPRMRGRYLQLPDDVVIPDGNCHVEISASPKAPVHLRFVIGGNHKLKTEPIEGYNQRGRHRTNTREPRPKDL